jgi:hypothetical protein
LLTLAMVYELLPGDVIDNEPRYLVEEVVLGDEDHTHAEVRVKTSRGETKNLSLPKQLPIVIEVPLKGADV